MKKFLVGLLLACTAIGAAYALQEVVLPSAARAAGTYNSSDMYLRDSGSGAKDLGIILTAPAASITGTTTSTFKVQGKDAAGNYYDLPNAAITSYTTGTSTIPVFVVRPGINHSAGATVSMPMPPVFRVQSTVSGTGSATYQINMDRTQ